MSRVAIVILILLVVVLVVGGLAALIVFLGEERDPEKHLIPEAFVGWVKAEYEVAGAPAIPLEGGYRIFRYGPDGRLATSSSFDPMAMRREYYYYSDDGSLERLNKMLWSEGGMIWGEYNARMFVDDDAAQVHEVESGFYVGTEEQYDNAPPSFGFGPLPLPPAPAAAPDRLPGQAE